MKNKLYWFVVFLTIFGSICFTVAFFHYLPLIKRALPSLRWRSDQLILSDLLFMEAGFLLAFGAMVAGYSLYKMTSLNPLKVEYWRIIFNWKLLQKESGISPALKIGWTLIALGICYMIISIFFVL